MGVLNATDGNSHVKYRRAPEAAIKALAVKIGEDKSRVGAAGQRAMKAAGLPLKADEIQQQDLTGFGDEWVGVAYSQSLWEAIRTGTFVAERLPSVEVPTGHESIYIPLEGADPITQFHAMGGCYEGPALFTLGEVSTDAPVQVFETPLRICVGDELKGRKLGIRYSVFGSNLRKPSQGKLRLLF